MRYTYSRIPYDPDDPQARGPDDPQEGGRLGKTQPAGAWSVARHSLRVGRTKGVGGAKLSGTDKSIPNPSTYTTSIYIILSYTAVQLRAIEDCGSV
jgi:hypothetical protein